MHCPVTGSHPSDLACIQLQRYAQPIPYRPRSHAISQSRPLKPDGHLHSPETKNSVDQFQTKNLYYPETQNSREYDEQLTSDKWKKLKGSGI